MALEKASSAPVLVSRRPRVSLKQVWECVTAIPAIVAAVGRTWLLHLRVADVPSTSAEDADVCSMQA